MFAGCFMWNFNMRRIDAVLVVEGKMDRDLIHSFLDCDIITTNGSAVSRETIELVRKTAKTRRVIVLTDPDAPGKRIRDILNNEVKGLENAFVPKKKAIKGHKVGVAECSKDTILEALEHLIKDDNALSKRTIEYSDLLDLGLVGCSSSKQKRTILEEKLHLGECNGKTLLKRCNMLGLTREDLTEVLHDEHRLLF